MVCAVQAGVGIAGCFAGFELLLVGHSGGSVRVHIDHREVQKHVDRVQLVGFFGALVVPEALCGIRGDAVLGDLVLSDFGSDCWLA